MMASSGPIEGVNPVIEANRMEIASKMRDAGLLGIGGVTKDFEEFVKKKSKEIGLDPGQTMERIIRGHRVEWITIVGEYLQDEWKKGGMSEDDAAKVFKKLYDDVRSIANPKYRRNIELGGKKDLTEAERTELGDLIADDFQCDERTGFNMFKAIQPLINSSSLSNEYGKEVLAGRDAARLLGLGLILIDNLLKQGPRHAKQEDDEFEAPIGKPDGDSYEPRETRDLSGGVTRAEFTDKSGMDPTILMEHLGIDANTPDGENLMFEILTDPATVSASKEPTSFSRDVLTAVAHDRISDYKRMRKQNRPKRKRDDQAQPADPTLAA
jgi:hypothetical protein